MQKTNDLYREILADKRHHKEVSVVAGEAVLWEPDIVSVSTSGGLYSTPGIGNCVSRQIRLSVYGSVAISEGMELRPRVRLVRGQEASELLQKGVFYAGMPETDPVSGIISVHGYDAMMRAEEPWLTQDYAEDSWPKTESEAVADIAQRMGVQVDIRTDLADKYMVDYPVDANGDLTMRQVLSYIAVANSGNWIMSDDGKLWLVPYRSMPPETNYLITEHGAAITFGGVRILVG